MDRIIFLGPPGAGKGTQAKLLCESRGLEHISTGVILRDAVQRETELGKKAKAFLDQGQLVTDELIIDLVREKLSSMDGGFLLDGFPRTTVQAEALESILKELGRPITAVIEIVVPDELIMERLLKRAADEGRSDDTAEVISERINVYQQQTMPVRAFYQENAEVTSCDGVGSVDEVHQRVVSGLT